jgi:hypothetical protein
LREEAQEEMKMLDDYESRSYQFDKTIYDTDKHLIDTLRKFIKYVIHFDTFLHEHYSVPNFGAYGNQRRITPGDEPDLRIMTDDEYANLKANFDQAKINYTNAKGNFDIAEYEWAPMRGGPAGGSGKPKMKGGRLPTTVGDPPHSAPYSQYVATGQIEPSSIQTDSGMSLLRYLSRIVEIQETSVIGGLDSTIVNTSPIHTSGDVDPHRFIHFVTK